MSNFQTLRFEEDNHIATLTINRPDKLNALNPQVLAELKALLTELPAKKLRGLILVGEGEKAFIAGADIKSMQNMSARDAFEFGKLGQSVSQLLENLSCPTVAAVNGFALGGGFEMALACDMIFSSHNAVFGLPEVKLGLIPGFGGTQRLARKVGPSLAQELIYSGRQMKNEEALTRGVSLKALGSRVELLTYAQDYLKQVAANSPLAVSWAKKVLHQGLQTTLEQGLEIEAKTFATLFHSYDTKEGTSAFVEKRVANFRGE